MKSERLGLLALVVFVGFIAGAAVTSCTWGGAKVSADVPIYGNATVETGPVDIEIPEDHE